MYISANKTFRSTDSGATWTEMSLDSLGGLTGIAGLATDPKISGVVYAAVTHGKVAKSTDFGVTWKALATLATSSPTNGSIFVDPRNSQNLYVSRKFGQGCFASNNVAADCAAFRSVDGGLTWQNVAVPAITRTIDFDRTNGDIYAGGVETGVGSVVLKSSDQGVTWTPVAKGFGEPQQRSRRLGRSRRHRQRVRVGRQRRRHQHAEDYRRRHYVEECDVPLLLHPHRFQLPPQHRELSAAGFYAGLRGAAGAARRFRGDHGLGRERSGRASGGGIDRRRHRIAHRDGFGNRRLRQSAHRARRHDDQRHRFGGRDPCGGAVHHLADARLPSRPPMASPARCRCRLRPSRRACTP